jgi:RNA polymerase sigma-70 factor (ECF subfamily)
MASQNERIQAGTDSSGAGWFATTHWSVVLTARDVRSPQAAEAMENLCRRYWPPIYAFIRRRGHGPDDAQDLTQEFFARLLAKHYLDAADAAKGKFRTLLLTAVTRFLINERERAQALKRGGRAGHFSLDAAVAEDGYRAELAGSSTPETLYERRWAETVLESVLARLREDFQAADQLERFEILKPFLMGEKQAPSGAEVAARLGVTETAAYSAVHRLRRRYGELLRHEIAHTVARPEEIDEELRHLVKVLSG